MKPVVLEGFGLHSGAPVRVTLARAAGAVTLNGTPIASMRVVDTTRATTVAEPRVRTVEHLFAALAALGVRDGLAIEVEGPELPLLDGGAARWCEIVALFATIRTPPRARVVAERTIAVGASRYAFSPAEGAEVDVSVQIDFGDPRLSPTAAWRGDVVDFVHRIASARTFALSRDLPELAARGLAAHIAPESVVLLTEQGPLSRGAPFAWDEPARHKLLDLIGDLYVAGGPPMGRIRAYRPGHAATHEALRIAIDEGVLRQNG